MKRPGPSFQEPERKTTQLVSDPNYGPSATKKVKTNLFDQLVQDTKPQHEVHQEMLVQLFTTAVEKTLTDSDDKKTEVEARFGEKSSKFIPGLEADHFRLLENWLTQLPGHNIYENYSSEFHYSNHVRVVSDYCEGNHKGGPSSIEEVQFKAKEEDIELKFTGHYYCLKIGIAKERSLSHSQAPPQLDHFNLRRDKIRKTFEHEGRWKIDLTQVKTHQGQGESNIGKPMTATSWKESFEVEVEISGEVWGGLKTSEDIKQFAKEFYEFLTEMLNVFKKGSQRPQVASPFPEIRMEHVTEEKKAPRLKTLVLSCFSTLSTTVHDFPGSMPVSFNRSKFPQIQQQNIPNQPQKLRYFFSEKTDGIRYFLLFCSEGLFLIDRKFAFFQVPDSTKVLDHFQASKSVSLFDGEMIRHKEGKVYFLVFDIVQFRGQPLVHLNLTNRLAEVSKFVAEFRNVYTPQDPCCAFEIMGKSFQAKIGQVFDRIKFEGGHRYFCDGSKRYHKTDGVIMTPDEPYSIKTCNRLFKWKFSDVQSIDFRASRRGARPDHFRMYIGVEGGEAECFETSFPPSQLQRLKEEWNKHKMGDDCIVECTYDVLTGQWWYHTLRPDKHTPNFIRVVFETLTGLAENISISELLERIPKTPEQDDWVKRQRAQTNLFPGGPPSTAHREPSREHSHSQNAPLPSTTMPPPSMPAQHS